MYTKNKRSGPSRQSFHGRPSRPSYNRSSRKNYSQTIHPSKFVKKANYDNPAPEVVSKHQFVDFELNDLLKQNITNKGYLTPSPIQDQAIPVGLTGRDIVGIANTGTGKTAAFGLPLLHSLMAEPGRKALIIAPTRELAEQIEAEFRSFGAGSGLTGTLLIGGTPMPKQLRELKNSPAVVIGTPGRIKDHMRRGTLDLSKFSIIVLDEVDRMLDMGFINDIRQILGELNEERQSYFFSATLDAKTSGLVNTFLSDPVKITVTSGETSDNVDQDVVRYNTSNEKIEKLHDTLLQEPVKKTLIFDETQRSVERLSKELQARGFKADAIHGGKTQGQRKRALASFKQNSIDILVATDVAARGIDVIDITHVINYTVPQSYDDYIHRVGRAGRAGRVGQALTFIDS